MIAIVFANINFISIASRTHCCNRIECHFRLHLHWIDDDVAAAANVDVEDGHLIVDVDDIVVDDDGDDVDDDDDLQQWQQNYAVLVARSSSMFSEDVSAYHWYRDAVDSYGWSRSF